MTLKLTDNPPSTSRDQLFELLPEPDRPWWVAHTKSRQEKALAWDLRRHNIDYYLPLVSRPQKNRNGLRMSIMPIFTGYLFFQGNGRERYEAVSTGRIARVIEVRDQETLHHELKNIAAVAGQVERLELSDFASQGQRVRIAYGPFAGIEGIVEKPAKRGRTKLILRVQAIGQAIKVEIDLDQVQPL